MKNITWNSLKNKRLKRTRGASFEDILGSEFVATKRHSKREHQNIMLFNYKGYIWAIPYVENDYEVFLKTLYPSRKYTRLYREDKINEEN